MNDRATSSPDWAIEAESLSKSFGTNRALRGVDINVRRGDWLTIFGPNGAGKTTLIKLLSTLAKPTGGSAWLHGVDINREPAKIRRMLGVVTHSTFLYNDLTVKENLRFYGRMYMVPNLEQRIEEARGGNARARGLVRRWRRGYPPGCLTGRPPRRSLRRHQPVGREGSRAAQVPVDLPRLVTERVGGAVRVGLAHLAGEVRQFVVRERLPAQAQSAAA